MHGNVQALFGGEGLVFLSDQDPASYPTLFVKKTLTGLTDRFSGIFANLTTEKNARESVYLQLSLMGL